MTERTLGTLPISVGTALAIEQLPVANMFKYHSFLINLRTIIRNARQAYEGEELPKEKELFEACRMDIIGIAEAIIAMKLKTVLELKIYYPTYRGLAAMFPMAKLKDETQGTEKQRAVAALDKKVAERLLEEFGKNITKVNCRIPDFIGQSLILSHHPVDLVTTDGYTRLNLVESHTGLIKTYSLFYTKLTGSDKLTNIPLNKLTIQIFGDNSTNFYSQGIKVKNEIKQLADAVKWSTASTPSLVARSIRSLGHSPEKEILLKMI